MKLTTLILALVAVVATSSTPIDKVHKLTKKLGKWSNEWIGVDGKIGHWQRQGVFQRIVLRIEKTFENNIKRCNPQQKAKNKGGLDEVDVRSTGCRSGENTSKACSIFEGVSIVQGFKKLRREYIGCADGGQRETGIRQRVLKLELVILSSVCQAHATTLGDKWNPIKFSVNDCKRMSVEANKSKSTDNFYDRVVSFLWDGGN